MKKKCLSIVGGLLVIVVICVSYKSVSDRKEAPEGNPEDTRTGIRAVRDRDSHILGAATDSEEIGEEGELVSTPPVGDLSGGREVPADLRDEFAVLSQTLEGSGQDAELVRSISTQWMAIDPKEAVEWALRLPDGLARTSLFELAKSAESESFPELFKNIQSAGNDSHDGRRNFGLMILVSKWAESAPGEAWDAISGITDPVTKASLYANSVSALAETEPAATAEKLMSLASLFPEGSEEWMMLEPSFGSVAGSLARESVQGAVDWVDSLEDGAAKEEATRSLASEYFKKDPKMASEWLYDLPEGRSRDMAIMSLISGTRGDDHSTRMAWALSMSSDDLKGNRIVEIGHLWKLDDAEGFQTWLATPEGRKLNGQWKSAILDEANE